MTRFAFALLDPASNVELPGNTWTDEWQIDPFGTLSMPQGSTFFLGGRAVSAEYALVVRVEIRDDLGQTLVHVAKLSAKVNGVGE